MFWIFTAFAGLMAFAVTLGQLSVWFALLKLALMVAVGVILVMGIALVFRKPKQNPNQ
jgi:hypothetical protein